MGKRTSGRPCDKPGGTSLSSLEKSTKNQTPTKETTIHSETESNRSSNSEAAEPSPKRANQKKTPPASTSVNMAPMRRSIRQRHSTLAEAFGDPIPINTIEESITHKKPVKFNIDSPPDHMNSPTIPSLKSFIQEMGFTDKTPEYQVCMNFLAISPTNKVKQTDEVINLISSGESPNKTVVLCIENKKNSNEADNTANNDATQEEHEKLEDDNNNQEAEETEK